MPVDDKIRLDRSTILLTRPREQSIELTTQLENLGARIIHFPVIEILPLDLSEQTGNPTANHIIEQLPSYDLAIFISSNAVIHGDSLVRQRLGEWPRQLKLAVIGPSSAMKLQEYGLQVEICPSTEFSSEGLLALPAMQEVQGKRIVIFRGQGGRETLASELRQRGAQVDYLEVYRRQRPKSGLADIPPRQRQDINVIIVASNESLQNLYDMADDIDRGCLLDMPLVVISSRSETLAKQLGFNNIYVASQATSLGLLEAVMASQVTQALEGRDGGRSE
jgi:uroporphyrinogen-III synthase